MEFNDNKLTDCTEDNFDEGNIENLKRRIDESDFDTAVVLKINEAGTGKDPNISDESRKVLAKILFK